MQDVWVVGDDGGGRDNDKIKPALLRAYVAAKNRPTVTGSFLYMSCTIGTSVFFICGVESF